MKIKLISIVVIFIIISCTFGVSANLIKTDINVNNSSKNYEKPQNFEQKKWTIMLYEDADCNVFEPLTEIENNVSSTENVNILVLQDRWHGPANSRILAVQVIL
ncbi:MAG: hypothetical protein KAW45_09495 [Thermoplasmatales archaeon]|nr:hypothetical protein [Thermoplasmatales archaeon]